MHVALADPVCAVVTNALHQAAAATGATVHFGGTYLCMEGPQFSTRAESRLYRQWGVDVIGMTNMPEAKRWPARPELCYATLALATDYDCWHASAADVDIGAILAILQRNVQLARSHCTHSAAASGYSHLPVQYGLCRRPSLRIGR